MSSFLRKVRNRIDYAVHSARHRKRLQQHPDKFGPQTSIVICGTGRSGTTWLGTVFSALPNAILQDEPFKPGHPFPKKLGTGFHQHVPQGTDWPELRDYFERLLSGAYFTRGSFPNHNFKAFSTFEYHVFKFIRLQLLLPWLVDQFTFGRLMYSIRNPYAVVASQLKHGAWKATDARFEADLSYRTAYYQAPYTDRIDLVRKVNTVAGVHALNWAIENTYLIKHPYNNKQWVTLGYEDLLRNPEERLRQLFRQFDLPFTEAVEQAIYKQSHSSQHSNKTIEDRLNKWQKQLSAEDRKTVDLILDEMEVDFFDREGNADLDKIYNR